jgi:hypothetical protein
MSRKNQPDQGPEEDAGVRREFAPGGVAGGPEPGDEQQPAPWSARARSPPHHGSSAAGEGCCLAAGRPCRFLPLPSLSGSVRDQDLTGFREGARVSCRRPVRQGHRWRLGADGPRLHRREQPAHERHLSASAGTVLRHHLPTQLPSSRDCAACRRAPAPRCGYQRLPHTQLRRPRSQLLLRSRVSATRQHLVGTESAASVRPHVGVAMTDAGTQTPPAARR